MLIQSSLLDGANKEENVGIPKEIRRVVQVACPWTWEHIKLWNQCYISKNDYRRLIETPKKISSEFKAKMELRKIPKAIKNNL